MPNTLDGHSTWTRMRRATHIGQQKSVLPGHLLLIPKRTDPVQLRCAVLQHPVLCCAMLCYPACPVLPCGVARYRYVVGNLLVVLWTTSCRCECKGATVHTLLRYLIGIRVVGMCSMQLYCTLMPDSSALLSMSHMLLTAARRPQACNRLHNEVL